MTPLLIVGHPYANYSFVETSLHGQGMLPAKDSRREQLSPIAISQKLLKTQNITFDSDICQIEAGDIWNELALDLLLGNIEQSFWGWADPQAIFMLDYWKKVEPSVKFLLVYESPVVIFTAFFKNKQVTKKALEQEVKHWNAFYEELLHFYHRNQENCLLVHIEQVRDDLAAFIHAVSVLVENSLIDADVSVKEVGESNVEGDRADLLLMTELLKEFSGVHAAYEGLQAVANLPLLDKEVAHAANAVLAWNDKQTRKEVEVEKIVLQQDTEQFKELEEENELLLLQLHQVQEELEHYFLENQKLIAGGSEQTAVSRNQSFRFQEQSSGQQFYYGAGERIKRQLSYRLGAMMIKQSRTVTGWLTMPWALIQETKAFRKDLKQRKGEKLPPISDYQDAYEAEQVKQHLSYRLGHTMVKNTNSVLGWIKLPWLLRQEIIDFQRRRGVG
jgi:hypothetical protein